MSQKGQMRCLRFFFAAEGLVLIVHFNTKATCERESETKREAWFLPFVFAPNSVFFIIGKKLITAVEKNIIFT